MIDVVLPDKKIAEYDWTRNDEKSEAGSNGREIET